MTVAGSLFIEGTEVLHVCLGYVKLGKIVNRSNNGTLAYWCTQCAEFLADEEAITIGLMELEI